MTREGIYHARLFVLFTFAALMLAALIVPVQAEAQCSGPQCRQARWTPREFRLLKGFREKRVAEPPARR